MFNGAYLFMEQLLLFNGSYLFIDRYYCSMGHTSLWTDTIVQWVIPLYGTVTIVQWVIPLYGTGTSVQCVIPLYGTSTSVQWVIPLYGTSTSVQWVILSGIGCYGFCLALLVLVYSRVRLGLFAYVSCFVFFCFWLCYGRLSMSLCFFTSCGVPF